SLPQIREHLAAEQKQVGDELLELERQREKLANEGTKLRELCHQLESDVKLRYELAVQHQAVTGEHETRGEQIREIERRLSEVSAQLAEIGEVEFNPSQFQSLSERIGLLEKKKSQYDRLTGELARRPMVDTAIQDCRKKLDAAKNDAAVLSRQLAGSSFSERAFAEANDRFQQAQQHFESARHDCLVAAKEREISEKELEGKLEQLRRFEQAAQDLEACRTGHYYGEKLAGLMTQYRSLLIARIRPTLAEFSSRLISEMTDGRYSLVELDEKYNLRLMDSGRYYGVDRFSGGEKDLANLCLRLAISLALMESAGLTNSFIILDEVFGSQDNERKELIIRSLANLKHRFPQILLITHVEDIKDRVEQLVEVVPTGNGWSEVRVNGNLTV
ncbi:MAG: hypothetical protein AB1744_08975, partial [Candidatus Zixiibacteriota bacterium]